MSPYAKKALKHTLTSYDFLQDHSQKVLPQTPKEHIASARMTDSSLKIFEPKKYENSKVRINQRALNYCM